MTTPTKLCLFHLATLEAPLTLSNSAVLPAGTEVMLLPQTTAASVSMGSGKTLGELWPPLATAMTGYAGELARYADRLTKLEAQYARLETWARQHGYTGE